MKILVAEDESVTRMSLKRQLEKWGHEVVAVEDGERAWAVYREQGGGQGFDVVITDWEMPNLSGVELIRMIREKGVGHYVYVIMLTGRTEKGDLVNGMEAGADDFVSKPFDKEELRVRVLAGERILRLERTLQEQNAKLLDASIRMKNDLAAAARIQRSMLPRGDVVTERVRTAWTYMPCDGVAGDAVGLHLIDERYLVAYVFDVSGHGVPAALLSVSAMRAMDPASGSASLLRDLSGGGLGTVRRPAVVASEMNKRFQSSGQDGRYLTMVLTVLDTHTGVLHFSSAGHPPPTLMRGEKIESFPDAGGFPVGIMDGGEYEEGVLQLEAGDRFLMLSDGVLEQTQGTGSVQFGDVKLPELLSRQREGSIGELIKGICGELTTWANAPMFGDDVSLLVVEWMGKK